MSAVIGIDCGEKGWIVAVDTDGIAWAYPMPDSESELVDILERHRDLPVFIEQQQAAFSDKEEGGTRGTSPRASFTAGDNFGFIRGVVATLHMRRQFVRPRDWQTIKTGLPKPKGKRAEVRKELKRQSVLMAERLWPSSSFRGPRGGAIDGKAEAALIAEFGRRLLMGER
jgi:hypothetical protein